MKLLIHCLQVAPWSKTGGLGDVCGSLPPALAARGHRVMVVAPQYKQYPEPSSTGVSCNCLRTWGSYTAEVAICQH